MRADAWTENRLDWLAQSLACSAILLLAVAVALGICGTLGYASSFELGMHGMVGFLAATAIVPVVLMVFAFSFHLARRPEPLPPAAFLATLTAGGLAAHLLMVASIDPQWANDYRQYWEHARQLASSGVYSGRGGAYEARSLFFPYLVVKYVGPDARLALKILNVLALCAMQVALYDIARRIRGHQAAQSSAVLFAAAPLPALAALMPSHDLWGIFFLVVALWTLAYALHARNAWPAARTCAIVATGVLAYLAEVQRSLGTILCAALALSCLLLTLMRRSRVESRHGSKLILVAALAGGTYGGCIALDAQLGLLAEGRPMIMNMKYASNAGGLGSGIRDWSARFKERFKEGYSTPESAIDLTISGELSSWAIAPADRLQGLAVHTARLFSATLARDWDWLFRHPQGIPASVRDAIIFYCDVFGAAFGLALLLALLMMATSRPPAAILPFTSIVFLIALALPLAFVFETKPYNLFPIWMIGPLLIGDVAARKEGHLRVSLASILKGPTGMGALLIVVAVCATSLAARWLFTTREGRLLSDFTLATNQTTPDDTWKSGLLDAAPMAFSPDALRRTDLAPMYLKRADHDADRIRRYAGHVVTKMAFPRPARRGDTLDLSSHVCAGSHGRDDLEFFVYAPKGERGDPSIARFDLLVGGDTLLAVDIPFSGDEFRRMVAPNAIAAHQCLPVHFRMTATDTQTRPGAPSVEIWMPRLVRDVASGGAP